MKLLRTTLSLACLSMLAVVFSAQAQTGGSRPRGITDIMRGGGARPAAPALPAPRATPAAPTGQRAAEFIVALVNSEPITNTEVQKRVARVLEEAGAEADRMPRALLTRQVLEQLIIERAQLQLAKENGIKVDDLAVDQAEQVVARQNQISNEELRRRLASAGVSVQEFRSNVRNQLLLTRLRERELEPKVKVSDLEVDQYLQEQRGKAEATVKQTHVRHILIRPDARRNTAQVVEQLNDFKRRIQGGTADFAGLARDNSQDGSAKNGGDLGWAPDGMFVPEFEEAMNRLKPGEISEPVVSRFGVHLIQVQGRREAKLSPEEQRDAARSFLRDKKMDEAYEAWAQEVRGRAYVEFREPPQS